jgi:hypothetical protein
MQAVTRIGQLKPQVYVFRWRSLGLGLHYDILLLNYGAKSIRTAHDGLIILHNYVDRLLILEVYPK